MKIYADKIPNEGLVLSEDITPERLGLDLDSVGIKFINSIGAKADIKKIGKEVFATVKIESPVECTCALCLAKFQGALKKKFDVSYEISGTGDIIDIDEDIRQELILDYPMQIRCKPDCKGLCPNCGGNLNIADCDCK